MRKFTRISLMIVAVMAGTGVLLMGIASVMGAGYSTIKSVAQSGGLDFGHWHFGDGIYWGEDDGKTEGATGSASGGTDIYRYPVDSIRNLDVEIGAAELVFEEGAESSQIIVTIENGNAKYYEGGMDGNTLEIEYAPDETHLAKGKTPKIIVRVPGDMSFGELDLDIKAADMNFEIGDAVCEKLSLSVGAGVVTVSDVQVEDELDVDIGVGTGELKNVSCRNLDVECGMGNFTMNGVVEGDIDAECSMGSMTLELEGDESDYNYDLSCGMGELTVNGMSYSAINGSRDVKNKDAVGTIRLDCGMGSINLEIW